MTTILFIVSCFAIFLMIGSKIFEIKVKKIESLARIYKNGDAKIHRFIELVIFKYNRYKKIAHIFIFDFLPSYAYELSVKLKDYIAKKYYEADGRFRGRRILRDNGSVSTFLKHITDDISDATHHKI